MFCNIQKAVRTENHCKNECTHYTVCVSHSICRHENAYKTRQDAEIFAYLKEVERKQKMKLEKIESINYIFVDDEKHYQIVLAASTLVVLKPDTIVMVSLPINKQFIPREVRILESVRNTNGSITLLCKLNK